MLRMWLCKRETSSSSSSAISGLSSKNPISISVVQGIVALGTFGVHFEEAYSRWARKSKGKHYIEAVACYERSQYRLNGPSSTGHSVPFGLSWLWDQRLNSDLSMESDLGCMILLDFNQQLCASPFPVWQDSSMLHIILKWFKVNPCVQFWPEYPVIKEGAKRNRDDDDVMESSSIFQEKLKTFIRER